MCTWEMEQEKARPQAKKTPLQRVWKERQYRPSIIALQSAELVINLGLTPAITLRTGAALTYMAPRMECGGRNSVAATDI